MTASVLRTVNKSGSGRSRQSDNKSLGSLGMFLDITTPCTPEGSTPSSQTRDTPSKDPENLPSKKRACSEDRDIHSAAHTPSGICPRMDMCPIQPFAELKDIKRVSFPALLPGKLPLVTARGSPLHLQVKCSVLCLFGHTNLASSGSFSPRN